MSIQQSYDALATLLEYPYAKDGLIESCAQVTNYLDEKGLPVPVHPFQEMVQSSTLAELQEQYVANFDFNPAVAPYLGHHLYGDNQKKASYMITVKQEFKEFDFAPSSVELPDHVGVVLSFLAHLARRGEDAVRQKFIRELVLPGLEKFVAACAPSAVSPWLTLIEAARLLCNADCQEVSTC